MNKGTWRVCDIERFQKLWYPGTMAFFDKVACLGKTFFFKPAVKRKRQVFGTLLVATLVLTCFAIGANQIPCRSQSMGRNFDYIFDVETDQVRNEFEYKNSLIGPVIKTRISYTRPNIEDSERVQYEDLWNNGWQTLGCRRINELDLQPGQVAIQVKHKSGFGSLKEGEAAAKAVLRLFVDLYARRQAVSVIILPDESFGYILNQMPQAGFTPGPEAQPDVPVFSPIVIPVRTNSGSDKQVLYYTTPPSAGGDE